MAIYDINGNALNSVYGLSGESLQYAYDIDGNNILDAGWNYDNYTITLVHTMSGSNFQAFSIHNGIIAQIVSRDIIKLIDLNTFEVQNTISVSVGHGNSCQFSNTYYSPDDEFPLLYSTDTYRKVFINRITRTGSTLLKTYYFDVNLSGYILGIGLDVENNILYTEGYTYENYQSSMGGTNKTHISAWDLGSETDNGDGTYSLDRLYTNIIDFFPCIQGSCYHNGLLFVSSGYSGTSQKVFIIEPTTAEIKHTINLLSGEVEGNAWVNNEYLLVGQSPSNIKYEKVLFSK